MRRRGVQGRRKRLQNEEPTRGEEESERQRAFITRPKVDERKGARDSSRQRRREGRNEKGRLIEGEEGPEDGYRDGER